SSTPIMRSASSAQRTMSTCPRQLSCHSYSGSVSFALPTLTSISQFCPLKPTKRSAHPFTLNCCTVAPTCRRALMISPSLASRFAACLWMLIALLLHQSLHGECVGDHLRSHPFAHALRHVDAHLAEQVQLCHRRRLFTPEGFFVGTRRTLTADHVVSFQHQRAEVFIAQQILHHLSAFVGNAR